MGHFIFRLTSLGLGARGERLAARYLRRKGYRILKTNYRCPAGEIDLIFADGDTLVFVEVKTRRSGEAAHPENSVNLGKQRAITAAARFFLAQTSTENMPCRFDVISIVKPQKGPTVIEHFVNAFAPQRSRRR